MRYMQHVTFRDVSKSYFLQAAAAYSKNWGHRERALREIYDRMKNLPASETDTSHNMLRASIPVINRALKDNVFSVMCR